MCENAKIAQKLKIYQMYKFIKMVRTGGIWDYKRLNPKYQDFGNYNFGYVSAAYGLPLWFARFGAGVYQIYSGTSRLEFYKSFFDDPRDQYWILEGYNDYLNDYWKCNTCNDGDK